MSAETVSTTPYGEVIIPKEITMKIDLSKTDRIPINVGMYRSEIVANIVKETKANDGTLVSGKFRIDGPSYAGYVLFKNFLIESNTHPGAAYYGRRDYIALLEALGLPTDCDTDDLVGRHVYIDVDIDASGQNVIKGFSKAEEPAESTKDDSEYIEDIKF